MGDEAQGAVLCEVCGEPATDFIGNDVLPVCDNVVCYHTRIEEVNRFIKEELEKEKEERNSFAHY